MGPITFVRVPRHAPPTTLVERDLSTADVLLIFTAQWLAAFTWTAPWETSMMAPPWMSRAPGTCGFRTMTRVASCPAACAIAGFPTLAVGTWNKEPKKRVSGLLTDPVPNRQAT